MRIEAPIPEENLFGEGHGRMEIQKSCLGAEVLQEALKVQALHRNFCLALICEFRPFLWQFCPIFDNKTRCNFGEALKVQDIPTKKLSSYV